MYDDLIAWNRTTATLDSISRLVQWDQETYMPPKGGPFRAEEHALLAGLKHERHTDDRLVELLEGAEAEALDERQKANVRELKRICHLKRCLPADLVTEHARTASQAQDVWKEAREKSDFAMFQPWLEKMTDLARRKAECYGTPDGGEAYDALMNEFEPGARAAEIESIFTPLGERLSTFLAELREGTPPDTAVLDTPVAPEKQHAFGLFILESLGFDMKAGRLDTTTHPFCEGMAPGDTRLTTRYRDERFTDALYGTMHECGHGLYEQGLPKTDHPGEPLGMAISLGIHESQSRMWENFVGRSREFWTWALPHANRFFDGALSSSTPEDLHRATNTATPSYIRVESDEATYNLHIMLRFRVERALLRREIEVKDVPGVWNETFRSLLGIDVPDDRRGCLQDVHWSFGIMGYFPTYCLGNLYAAQLWETINEQIPDLDAMMARGEFAPLLTWLNTNVHAHGMQYRAGELCEKLTGRPLEAEPLLRHLDRRVRPVYLG